MYPISVDISNRLCVIVGGGKVAERKVQGVLAQGAKVRLVSPQITSLLYSMVDQKHIEWRRNCYKPGDLEGAFLVFAATSSPETQEKILRHARAQEILINLADNPEQSDFHVPASFTRNDLCVTVSTHGKSPAMAAMVKRLLEQDMGSEYGILLQLMTQLRVLVLTKGSPVRGTSRELFQAILLPDILQWIKDRQWEKIQEHISDVLGYAPDIDWDALQQEIL
ncbi:precorrin-2 dehydrogenase/sirohydrochlorin ferrochelatase family protein [Desulfogranum japonicum]|uniref:precorrin-2 dehydrogenase/sirohydrochlorin ferrochelatase family protein n=1 Tax=Desulfogranum japonicum TaxID=231447 RepID=UPI0003F532EF|nr:bifunctional precorrin-2 dehydrogenase/sirohydrochlorin ferrochelatase [Desulfogranum japonicum]